MRSCRDRRGDWSEQVTYGVCEANRVILEISTLSECQMRWAYNISIHVVQGLIYIGSCLDLLELLKVLGSSLTLVGVGQ